MLIMRARIECFRILTHCVMWSKNLNIFGLESYVLRLARWFKKLRSTISKRLIVVKAPQYVKENSVDN
jgi:hypothetical protein